MEKHTAHLDNLGDLGVTKCTSCGASTEVVGALTPDGFYEGYCRHCTHNLAVHDILAEEARELLRAWIAARRQSYTRSELEGAIDEALHMLMPEPSSSIAEA